LDQFSKNSALAIESERKFVEIYDLHKGSLKQRFGNQKGVKFGAVTISGFGGVQSYANTFSFGNHGIFKQSGLSLQLV
jgi:hypothetical protein